MSDTIQSAEDYITELMGAIKGAITKGTTVSLITRAIDIAKLIKKRDADIRADEARKQAERYASCVEALKAGYRMLEIVCRKEGGCPFTCNGKECETCRWPRLESKARKALDDLGATK
jgi:hypothetical protein